MNRSDFQIVAGLRLSEAKVLIASPAPQSSGAYYLAGYAVECALKAVICNRYQAFDWPERKFVLDSHTHDLKLLCRLAEIETERENEARADRSLHENWLTVFEWDEASRYSVIGHAAAMELIEAIDDPFKGVLPWIMSRW